MRFAHHARSRAAVLLVFVGGCAQKADLAAASFVDGLRLIGVQAEPPEAAPGDAIMLTAWVVDTLGRSVDVTWSACTLPSNGTANAGCTDGSGNGLVGLGSGLVLGAVVPTVDAATLGPPDATLGVYLPIVVHARAGDDALDAVYRLRVRVASLLPIGCTVGPPYGPHCEPNRNPTIDRIDPLGPESDPQSATIDSSWALQLHYSDDSSEEYGNPAPVFERLTTQWFATGGSFPDAPIGGTGVQKLVLDRALPPSGGTIDLWAVGHDERGGTTLTHRTFVMQ
ncbi:MAG TPA: hypothetical protein VF334_14735 [Polyangia bacterium]